MAISFCALQSGTFLQLAPWPWRVNCFMCIFFWSSGTGRLFIPKPRFLCRQKPMSFTMTMLPLMDVLTFLVESIFVAFFHRTPQGSKGLRCCLGPAVGCRNFQTLEFAKETPKFQVWLMISHHSCFSVKADFGVSNTTGESWRDRPTPERGAWIFHYFFPA